MVLHVSKSEFEQLAKKAGRQGLSPAESVEKPKRPARQKKPVKRYFQSPGKKYLCIGLCLLAPAATPAIVTLLTSPEE